MASTRLLRMCRPFTTQSHETLSNFAVSSMVSRPMITLMCSGLSSGERNPVGVKAAAASSCVLVVSEPKTKKAGVDLGLLLAYVGDAMSNWNRFIKKPRPWGFHIQMFIEKAIIDCRFFTLLAIGGSLLGSVRCFVEGCFMIVASYLQYFHSLSQIPEQGQVVFQLIEAIDMFLMGTSMLVFALALHVMFVGQNNPMGKGSHQSKNSNSLKFEKVPSWLAMESAIQAKSKMGHALMMILQIQVLDKCKSIAVTNGSDLACFAAAIFLSSASTFLLSRSSIARVDAKP